MREQTDSFARSRWHDPAAPWFGRWPDAPQDIEDGVSIALHDIDLHQIGQLRYDFFTRPTFYMRPLGARLRAENKRLILDRLDAVSLNFLMRARRSQNLTAAVRLVRFDDALADPYLHPLLHDHQLDRAEDTAVMSWLVTRRRTSGRRDVLRLIGSALQMCITAHITDVIAVAEQSDMAPFVHFGFTDTGFDEPNCAAVDVRVLHLHLDPEPWRPA